jgi:uncharacterized protein YggT (Ycf19 family)
MNLKCGATYTLKVVAICYIFCTSLISFFHSPWQKFNISQVRMVIDQVIDPFVSPWLLTIVT